MQLLFLNIYFEWTSMKYHIPLDIPLLTFCRFSLRGMWTRSYKHPFIVRKVISNKQTRSGLTCCVFCTQTARVLILFNLFQYLYIYIFIWFNVLIRAVSNISNQNNDNKLMYTIYIYICIWFNVLIRAVFNISNQTNDNKLKYTIYIYSYMIQCLN